MKLDFRYICLLGVFLYAPLEESIGQETGVEPDLLTNENLLVEDVYVPPPPSEEDLRHYQLMKEADQKWSALFKDPQNASLHLDIAKHYNILGNGDIALHELGRAEALGIPREELLADIGRAYFLRDRYADILNEITIEAVPEESYGEVFLLRGHANYHTGNLEEAFLHYYQADLIIPGDDLELNEPLAKLYYDMGDYEKAEANVDKALREAPKQADLLILKGDLVHRRMGAEQSYQYYEKAHFHHPEKNETQSKYAAALYNLGRYDDMVAVLRRMLDHDNSDAFANYLIAANFARGNNIRTAIRYLNQAGNGYDDFVPGLLLKGKLSYATGNFDQVEDALKKLIRIEPDHGEGRRLLGASLLQQGKNREAVRVFEYLTRNNLISEFDYPLLGAAYTLAGDNDKGVEYLSRIVRSDIEKFSESQNRFSNDFAIGNITGVAISLEEILNNSGSVNQNLIVDAYKELNKRKYNDALVTANSIIDQNRNNPVGYNILGLIYTGQGKVDEARSNFRRAIQIDRDFHKARINIAKLELMLGNRNDGINYLNQILARNERYIPAYQLLYDIAIENNDLIAAERYLSTASTANSEIISPRLDLFDFYIEQNNLTRARTTAERMVGLFPDHASSYLALGKVELSQQNNINAQENLEKSLMLDNSNSEAYILLSQIYQELGLSDRVRSILHTGLLYVKDKKTLQVRLIELAEHDRDFANSQLYIDQLKLDEQTKVDAFIYEGELFLLQNRGEDALSSFKRAIRAGASEEMLSLRLREAEALGSNIATDTPNSEE